MSYTPRADELEERFSREHPDDLSGAYIAAIEVLRGVEFDLRTCMDNYYILLENMRQIEKIVTKATYETFNADIQATTTRCDAYQRGMNSDRCERCGLGEFEHGQIY
jgi:hypothetical protein